MKRIFRAGVISDTHGLARPEALAVLRGVDHILHAGDVGSPAVLEQLRQIAPLTAIRGNIDRDPWALSLPETAVAEVGDFTVYLIHNVSHLDLDPQEAGFAAVISGHSHQPHQEWRDGVLYLNPGSAGPRRFRLPIALGFLTIQGKTVSGEIVYLDV